MAMLDTIRSFVELGGPVVIILLVLSVFSLALIVVKLTQFWLERVGFQKPARRAAQLWRSGRYADARLMMENQAGVTGACLHLTMRLCASRDFEKVTIEEEVSRLALQRLHSLQRGFRALDSVSQIAPLLGLFGTVLGMIDAFKKLQAAGNSVDPSILAGGIWVALMTTAVGLAVAMPVSLILTWFETRLENERVAIETLTGSVLSSVAATEAKDMQQDDLIADGQHAY